MLGVAAVDLSGPHEPTPMVGQRLGFKPGHYFVVLTVEVDGEGSISIGSQTDMDTAVASQPPDGRDGSALPMPVEDGDPAADGEDASDARPPRLPLVYCEVVNQKGDAAAATERMLAQCRDEHGHLPSHAVFRLHSE